MREWWSDFFCGLTAELIRRVSSDAQTQTEAEFLVETLQPRDNDAILDVPCGNGRLSIALASRGYRVTGVDISEELLADANRATNEKKVGAAFERRDMRDLPWQRVFDRAYCLGNSFSYFDDGGNRAFLRAVHDALKPGGRFVLETGFAAETLFLQIQSRRWFPIGDLTVLHDTQYDPSTSRLTSTYILLRDGQTERREAHYQVYTCRELLERFRDAGFTKVETYGSLMREPFQIGSADLWIVAERG
jgi:cyclopropane fatty-acyl-phospholipid synthase-like methyltransferase